MGVGLEPHVSTVGFHRLRGPAAPKAKTPTLSLAFKVLQGRFLPLPLQPHPHRPGVETEALRGDHTCQGHSVRRWQSQIQIQACRDQSLGLAAPLPCPGCPEMLPPGGTCPPVALPPNLHFMVTGCPVRHSGPCLHLPSALGPPGRARAHPIRFPTTSPYPPV